jgi:hypothetical protein
MELFFAPQADAAAAVMIAMKAAAIFFFVIFYPVFSLYDLVPHEKAQQ